MNIESISALSLEEIEKNKDLYEKIGYNTLKEEKVGVVILSGGQGSRLGFNHAKGMYDVGINKTVYLFELLINNLLKIVNKVKRWIPLFIMTSKENNDEIIAFFKEHNYFNYKQEYVNFFIQNHLPALDLNNNIYLDKNGQQVLLPSGNGDWYKKLKETNLLDKYPSLEWLNCVAVDNPLQIMADPIFVGATIASNNLMGAKVIEKAYKDERVGVICKRNGKPTIIEYFEATEEMKNAKDEKGNYIYKYGVILNYLFNIKVLDDHLNDNLHEYHVIKEVKVDGEIKKLKKVETLILDMISFFDSVCIYEVRRNKEFAPIKNKEGIDSLETSRALLLENGIEL
ncbi:MAG: UTP--glucose-1-phosphate uridylyltransferase [Bacilli bacterium]|nr:UTP--glucose-1-phosphate uridylyltransferase [Bacilli bacterium]